jgi:hypothetical protein
MSFGEAFSSLPSIPSGPNIEQWFGDGVGVGVGKQSSLALR